MQITEIITDETLREIREHGTPEFPFEYYLDDIDEIGQGYVEWHWHNEIEWAWVESGKVICRIGNEKIILEAGEGIFINSRVIHRFETPGGALMPNILHAPELLAARESAIYQKYVSPVITYGKEYVILEKEKNSGILSLLDEIYKDAGKEMLRKELIIQNKISRLWDELFEGENLVASGVLMEAESVEDHGEGVKFNVYVYNVQPGITIDYSTGKAVLSDTDASAGTGKTSGNTEKKMYVLNENTKKFHTPECSGVKDIKEGNKKTFTGSREELIKEGYIPCGRCKP